MKNYFNLKHVRLWQFFSCCVFLLTVFSCSNEEDLLDTVTANDEFNVASLTTSLVQGENYDAQSGIQVVSGSKVGYVNNGDWIRFEDFDFDGANSVTVNASSGKSGGTIEFRAGGPNSDLLGTVSVSGTGGWNNFRSFTGSINDNSSNSDLYLVFKGGSGYLLDIDSFSFSSSNTNSNSGTAFPDMVGKTVRLQSAQSNNYWLRISDTSVGSDTEVVSQSNTGSWPRWVVEQVVSDGNTYYRFKNARTGARFRPREATNNSAIYMPVDTWTGNWTQWSIVSDGNGNYTLRNRSTGTYLSSSNSSGSTPTAVTSLNGLATTWNIVDLSGNDINGESDGGTSNPPSNGGGDTPGEILGLTNNDWKLNGFTSTPSSSSEYFDDVMDEVNGNIATWTNNNYFFANNGYAYFKCYRGLNTSRSSSNPRVELREMDGGNEESWNGDNGSHIMSFTVRVDQLPNGWNEGENEERSTGTMSIAQIHGPSDVNSDGVEVDDTIRIQFEGSRGQTSGSCKMKISGYITEEVLGGSVTIDGFSLDTEYDMQLRFINDRVSVVVDGNEVFGQTMDTAGNGSYFKLGAYLQSVQNGSFDGSFGLVGYKNLSISGH